MKIVLYFHLHQPWRLARFRYIDLGSGRPYFDRERNLAIFRGIAERSYRPGLTRLKEALDDDPDFRFSLSVTGTFVEQAYIVAPDILATIRELVRTGRVSILAETYPHSLGFLLPAPELEEEVEMHRAMVEETFGYRPRVLRMTELAFSNDLARFAEARGFEGMLAEGWEPVLNGRSTNQTYRAAGTKNLKVLPRNYRLSDDIGFRFSAKGWSEYPLTAEKYARWLGSSPGEFIGIFMDFETLGEHHPATSGIFDFFSELPRALRSHSHLSWGTVEDACQLEAREEFSTREVLTWADQRRDLGAWLGNDLQLSAFEAAKKVGTLARLAGDPGIIATWRRLLTSDHFYYMYLEQSGEDRGVHQHFSSYGNPYDAYANYMNALTDLRQLLDQKLKLTSPTAPAAQRRTSTE
jgi:alpha-amylase